MATVVLIEDDAPIRLALDAALRRRGHEVLATATARAGLDAVAERRPHVVVLDLGLPDADGAVVLRRLRATSTVPVVVITARQSERDVIMLLHGGADDYVVKPFSPDHLDARIQAVLRRAGTSAPEPELRVGPLVLDRGGRIARLDDRVLSLSRMEFDLLAYLAARQGQVVSRHRIMADVWHQPYGGADRTIDVHLSWLRRKLGETAAAPRLLHTVRGVGVKLTAPDP